jgi:tricorn protease
LLRYPDIHGDKVVFVYGGDLWLADAAGGTARRLTSDRGEELFPKFSPDGRQVAFTGQYSGTRQVHVIDVDGGAPRQLTFRNDIGELPPRGGYDNQVLGWTPDGKKVLFNAHRVPWSDRISRPYLVPAAGGMETPLPMPEGAGGTLSPDGNRYVYTPIMREFRTWKRYYGGRAQDLWIYDLKKDTAEQITDYKGTDNQPVWIGDTIYFTSDRDFFLNLYAYDVRTRQVRKVTSHNDYDVLWPSGDDRRVVYEAGGSIYLFDPAGGQSRRVPIRVQGDLPHTLPYFKNVAEDIQSYGISPTGKRAVFGARGDVFTVPAEKGEARNLTRTPGVREMEASWSPDGRWIAYLSDRTGEYEIYVRRSHGEGGEGGEGEERRITRDGDVWRFPPVWSPDSRKLVFSDKKQRLRYVEVDGGRMVDVDKGVRNDITDYRWSPDSRWLTYTKVGPNRFSSVWIYSLEKNKPYQLTSDLTNEAEPVFDPKGRYLYFLSNRDFNLTYSGFEFDYVYTDPTRVYVAVLSKDGPALFLPESDEEEFEDSSEKPEPPRVADQEPAQGKEKEDAEAAGDAAKPRTGPVKIDVDGFELRVRAIPGPAGNYRNLAVNENAVFYLIGRGPQTQLKMYNLDERKEEVVLDGVQSFELSADGKKILFRQGQDYGVVDAKPGQKAADHKLALDRVEMQIVPREEWRQMWVDAWRTLRDWFYDPAMHGVDWKAMREKYGQMLPYVATRDDLDFLFGELASELSAGHVYVGRGNAPGVERVENGLLGAEVEAHSSGYFRVAKIYPGENWHEDFRSPLTEPGVNVEVGDYILAVDGESTKGVDNFYRLLQNKADRVVTLLVNGEPATKGAREERVQPVKSEQNLRYLDWVLATRARVEKASNGRIGYIHLPNTAEEGNRELFKYFYPQADKDALIVDDRYNGGGFIPDQMIALLSRPRLSYWARRGLEPTSTPAFAHTGPKVTLINGQAGSGGDAFPYYFKKTGLGPLIGTRTWGGLIGLSGTPPLLDGGGIAAPSFRFFTTEGEWAVENEGVAPDLEVVDSPDLVAKGQDPSLETAISYLLGKLEQNPPKEVKAPEPPKGGAPR